MSTGLKEIPGVEKRILVESTPVAPKHGEATAITLKNGDVLLLWSEFLDVSLLPADERPPESPIRGSPWGDDGYARISGMRSSDGGRTWSPMGVVVDDRDAAINCMSPALTRLADGRLLLAYSWRSGGNWSVRSHVRSGDAARRVRFSEDDGQCWSDPIQVTPPGGYHTGCHDRAWTLPSGRVLIQCHSRFEQPGPPETWRRMTTWIAYSDDHGQSWQHSNRLDDPDSPRGFAEGCLAERADGSLLMLLRSTRGQSFATESFDEGATWTPPRPSGVVTSAAPSLLTRLPQSDDLLLVWNPNYNPDDGSSQLKGQRCPLLCAISRDGGRTWGLPKALETDPTYWWEYPGIHFHDGFALLHYRRFSRDRKRCDLVLARIPIPWFREPDAGCVCGR